jgi:2-oxoglutarate ferredoxin oxidoreductase subunit beta
MRMCELLSGFERVRFLARGTVASPPRVREMKRLLKKAFQYQMDGVGYSLVEVLSPCPTYWRLKPAACSEFIENTMAKVFPMGIIKDTGPGSNSTEETAG